MKLIRYIKKHSFKLAILLILLSFYAFCLPSKLFDKPTATVIESSEGELLGAKIANDGQWRFPKTDSVPYKFKQCIIQFEDAYFYKHLGLTLFLLQKLYKLI